jgi:hypothetical protein
MFPWVALFFEYYTMPLASHSYSPHIMKAGTVGGTLLVIIIQIQQGELIKTAILASIGAVVSFGVTAVLRWVMKKVKRK